MKLAKIKPEKLERTTIGRIDIEYMTGKKVLQIRKDCKS